MGKSAEDGAEIADEFAEDIVGGGEGTAVASEEAGKSSRGACSPLVSFVLWLDVESLLNLFSESVTAGVLCGCEVELVE